MEGSAVGYTFAIAGTTAASATRGRRHEEEEEGGGGIDGLGSAALESSSRWRIDQTQTGINNSRG